jgi:hypothetical protein
MCFGFGILKFSVKLPSETSEDNCSEQSPCWTSSRHLLIEKQTNGDHWPHQGLHPMPKKSQNGAAGEHSPELCPPEPFVARLRVWDLAFFDRLQMKCDEGDLWEFFLYAVFEGTGDVVNLG